MYELPEDTHVRSLRTAIDTDDADGVSLYRDTLLAMAGSGRTMPELPSPDQGGWLAYCQQRSARLSRIARVIAAVPPVVRRPWDWELDGMAD